MAWGKYTQMITTLGVVTPVMKKPKTKINMKTENQKLIEHLRQYCSKELSFGCEFEVRETAGPFNRGTTYSLIYQKKGFLYAKTGSDYFPGYKEKFALILGHPPTLNELLRALNDTNEAKQNWIRLYSNGDIESYSGAMFSIPLTTQPPNYPEELCKQLNELLGI